MEKKIIIEKRNNLFRRVIEGLAVGVGIGLGLQILAIIQYLFIRMPM